MITTESNNSKVLTSLALMETSLLSQDYLSTFIPFIATLTLKNKYDDLDINTVVVDFATEFGINIPRAPMSSILSRCVNNGLVTQSQDGKYYPKKDKMQELSFLNRRNEDSKSISHVIDCFINFSTNHDVLFSQNEAIGIFIGFLEKNSSKTIAGDTDDLGVDDIVTKRDLYLIGAFIRHIFDTDTQMFEIIQRLAMAYLVSEALTYDLPADTRTQEFHGLTVYLDTPIALRLLGLQSEEFENAYKEMFDNFNETIKPIYKVFQHTFDEISGIIKDCATWIDNSEYNPVYANPALLCFVEKKFNRTQVELYHTALEDKLNEYDIEVDRLQYYDLVNHSKQIDINVLQERLVESYKARNPQYDVNNYSIGYDVQSIDNIIKLWGTKSSRRYSTLGYIFLTNNATLAYVCRKFTSDYWWDNKNHKSPCITDYYLGTMVWLSTPAEKMEAYSKLKLLADCSSATTLSWEVKEKFLSTLERLQETKGIRPDDFLLLRQYAFEKKYLSSITLNEENAFKDDTIENLLNDIKNDIQKPLILDINKKEEIIDELKIRDTQKTERIRQLESEKLFEQEQDACEQIRLKNKSELLVKKIGKFYSRIVFAIFALTFAVFTFIVPNLSNWTGLVSVVSGIMTLTSVLFYGIIEFNILGLRNRLKSWLLRHYKIHEYKKGL